MQRKVSEWPICSTDLRPRLQNFLDITSAMKNRDHLQRFRFVPVNDEVGEHWKEFHFQFCQIPSPVSYTWMICEELNSVSNSRLDAICYLFISLIFDVEPDIDEVSGGLRSKNVTASHSCLALSFDRYSSSLSSGMAL